MAGYVAAYRIGMLVSRRGRAGAGGLAGEQRRRRATRCGCGAISPRRPAWRSASSRHCWRPNRTRRRKRSITRTSRSRALYETATGAFGEFLMRDAAIAVLLFVVLFKFCDAFAGALTAAFVIDIGFDKATYAAVVKGVGLAAAADRRLCRRRHGARLAACDQPVDRRHFADGVEPDLLMARRHRRQRAGAHCRHHRREFHQRHRHRDVRRLSLGAVPRPAAHRHAIRAADRARRGRPHYACFRRRLHRRVFRLGVVLRHLRAAGDSEPAAACGGCKRAAISNSGRRRRARTASAA